MYKPTTHHLLHLGSDEDLEWRLNLVAPGDVMRGMFFNSVLDVVRRLAGEDAAQRCQDSSGEARFLDFFNYPHRSYIHLIYMAARILSEKFGSFELAMREIGYDGSKTFYSSAAGKVLLLMAQGDPRRLISNVPTAMQTASKNWETKVTLTGPKSGVIVRHDLLPRQHFEGGFKALFDAARIKGAQIRSRSLGPTENEYELSWD